MRVPVAQSPQTHGLVMRTLPTSRLARQPWYHYHRTNHTTTTSMVRDRGPLAVPMGLADR